MGSLAEWLQKRSILRTSDDLIAEPIPVRLVEVTDSAAARQNLLNTSGQVTEASGASILSGTNYMRALQTASTHPTFANISTVYSTDVISTYLHRRLFQSSVTATAGGEIVAVAVGPAALAGYQPCMRITHIWSDQTDGSISLAWAPSAGTLDVGLATTVIATTANTVTPDWGEGLYWQGSDDNSTLQVSCAAGQAGNAQVIVFCGEYWYET